MNVLVIMFWLLLILTAAMCAPLTKDPYDLSNRNSHVSEYEEGNLDALDRIVKSLIAESKDKERSKFRDNQREGCKDNQRAELKDNKRAQFKDNQRAESKDNQRAENKQFNSEFDMFIETLGNYINYKEFAGLSRTDFIIDSETASDSSQEDEFIKNKLREGALLDQNESLKSTYNYIDNNIKDIINELVYTFTKKMETNAKNTKHDRKQNEDKSLHALTENLLDLEEPMGDAYDARTESQSDTIIKRAFVETDGPKEAPLVDIALDVDAQTGSDNFNMKLMYQKRGGICTLINGYSKTPIYVIATCRLGYNRNSHIWELCEVMKPFSDGRSDETTIDITQTPVQDSEGFVYRNVYCAQCNYVSVAQAWTTRLDCEHMQHLSLLDGIDHVTLLKEFVGRSTGCVRKLSPAVTRMIHQCTHADVINYMRNMYHKTRIGGSAKTDSPFPLSFSILMNFGFDGKTHILFSTTASQQTESITCNVNEKFDPQFQKCRSIVCTDGYQLIEGSCEKITNYNSDTNPDDLSTLNDIEEPLQVILTIKNITYGDIYMLAYVGIEDLVIGNLATMFNISKERIQNLRVDLFNSTSLKNHTGYSIEIHRFTTPIPSKIIPHDKQSKYPGEHESSGISQPTQHVIDYVTKRERDPTGLYKVYTGPPNRFETDDDGTYAVNESGSGENTEMSFMVNKASTSKIPDTGNRHKASNTSIHTKDDDGANSNNVSSALTDITDVFWTKNLGMSIRISFVLKPAHRNTTILEKSVKTVVQTMSDLINSNNFMLTLNGTDYQVQGVENAPEGTSMDKFCTQGNHPLLIGTEFYILREYDIRTHGNVTVVTVNRTGFRYYPGDYDLTFNIDGNVGNLNETQMSSWVFVCNMPRIIDEECARVVLSKKEYHLLTNKSICFANRTYNMSEYEYVNEKEGTVGICIPSDWVAMQTMYEIGERTLACGDDLMKIVIVESYLSFVLGVISLACMMSVLITYGLFDRLRNLPGANTMNLTVSLFMGELVFITSGWIQPHQEWLCSAVGMLLHYLFLASFFWMNVMSYDVFRTFGNKCILTRIRKKKKYLPRYFLYAWGCPLLIVSLCGLLDFTDLIEGVDIGYGGNSAIASVVSDDLGIESINSSSASSDGGDQVYRIGCWIQRPVASMVAFGGPMILILFSNIVMFTRTIICIRASTLETRTSVRRPSVKRLTGGDDVMLYIRMSTVMGFTWIFGLASSVISGVSGPTSHATCIVLHLLGILFIVFNCSQGMFIYFAFLFNRRVFALYKGLVERLKAGRSRPVSVSSSRTLTTNVSQTSLSHIS